MSLRGRLIIEGGVVAIGDGRVADGATLVIDRRFISEVRLDGSRPSPMPSDSRLNADGRLVTPGLVDGWAVLPPERERAAAQLAEGVLMGTTSAVALVPPSLAEDMVGFVERLGIRNVLGIDAAAGRDSKDAMDAIRRLCRKLRARGVPLTPALAMGRCATCSDDSLTEALEFLRSSTEGAPFLIGGAANDIELEATYERFGCRPIERLRRLGVLGPRTFVGHGNLLDSEEIDTLAKTGSWLVACPRSAWLEGHVPPVDMVRDRGGNLALGTAEVGPSPLAELTALATIGRGGPSHGGALVTEVLMGGASMMASLLKERVGTISPGALADLVIHRCRPSRPVDGDCWPRVLEGTPGADWVMVGGRVVLREGRLVGVDLGALARAGRRARA